DHAPVQRVVHVGEFAQVAHHRGFRVVGAEHVVGEVFLVAGQTARDDRRVTEGELHAGHVERGQHCGEVAGGGGLVTGDAHVVGVGEAEVHAALAGRGVYLGGTAGNAGQHRVEERVVDDLHSTRTQRVGEFTGGTVGTACDRGEPLRAVVHGVHRGEHGGQHLGGADVGGGFLPADVLFPGLQRQPVGLRTIVVDGHADEPAGQVTFQALADADVAGVRAAVAERHPEPLGGADSDVGAEVPGGTQHRQRQQVGGDGAHGACRFRLAGDAFVELGFAQLAFGPRILHDHAEIALFGQVGGEVADVEFDTDRRRAGAEHVDVLRQTFGVDQQ